MRLGRGEHGKPHLLEGRCEFNLSHSEGYAALGVQQQGPLGVDIEDQNRQVDWKALTERFFARPEVEAARLASDPRSCFFEIWTAKEAYIKALGSGLYHPLDQFVTLRPGQSWQLTDLEEGRLDFHLQRLQAPWPEVSAAWVSPSPSPPLSEFYQPEGS